MQSGSRQSSVEALETIYAIDDVIQTKAVVVETVSDTLTIEPVRFATSLWDTKK